MVGSLKVNNGQKIVFIGDSITDCGCPEEFGPLGNGYVHFFADLATAQYPERLIVYVNKGIGGETIADLEARWDDEVLREKPHWLSVGVGINDLHLHLAGDPRGVSPEEYRETYEALMEKTKKNLWGTSFVLIEPFYICREDAKDAFQRDVLRILPEYLKTVEEMAETYKAHIVKTHQIFQRHLHHRDPEFFGPEPVHPDQVGHMIIAEELLKALSTDTHLTTIGDKQ